MVHGTLPIGDDGLFHAIIANRTLSQQPIFFLSSEE
jgi:hypothetical protein